MSKYYYESLTGVEQARLVSATKRLNERMRELERQGLTETKSYQNLQSWVASMPNRLDKTGHLRAVQTYKLTPAQMRRTNAISNNKSVSAGAEKKAVEDFLKANGKTIDRTKHKKMIDKIIVSYANNIGKLHDFITTHADAYYGTELHTAVKRSWAGNKNGHSANNLTLEEVDKFIELMKNTDKFVAENRENYETFLADKFKES